MRVACRSRYQWLLVALFIFVPSAVAFGQTNYDECMGMYNKFRENRTGPEVLQYQIAIDSGKAYLSKCATLENGEKVKDYLTKSVPVLEDSVKAIQEMEALNKALAAKDVDKAFSLGKQVLNQNPNGTDVMMALALAGQNAALNSQVDKYNDDTIKYAKVAIEKMSDPAAKTAYIKPGDCGDSRLTALAWMNSVVGELTWYRQNDHKVALPYLYNVGQSNCSAETGVDAFQLIGASYYEDYQRLEADRLEKGKAAGGKETEETTALYALEMGYLERIMDAYGRAYNAANTIAKYDVAKKANILEKAKAVYNVRHEDKPVGFDEWLKGLGSTKLADPTSKVEPVALPDPTPSASATPNKP